MLVFVNNNYESGCILQLIMTHHVVSMMTELRREFAFHYGSDKPCMTKSLILHVILLCIHISCNVTVVQY